MTDQIVLIAGKLEEGETTPILIAESVKSINQVEEQEEFEQQSTLEVAIPSDADRILLSKIYHVLKENPGDEPTYLVLPAGNGSPKKFAVPFGSKKSINLEKELEVLGCRILT